MKSTKVFGAVRATTLAALCAGSLALAAGGCKSGDKSCGSKSCSGEKGCSGEKQCSGDKKCSGEKKCSADKQCGQGQCGAKK